MHSGSLTLAYSVPVLTSWQNLANDLSHTVHQANRAIVSSSVATFSLGDQYNVGAVEELPLVTP